MTANIGNLIPQSERTKEEQRAIAKMGGIASGKARREKKMFRETLESLLSMPMRNGKCQDIDEIRSFASVKGKNISVQDAVLIAQIQKAMKGDTKAAEFIRDTSGQSITNKVDVTGALPVIFSGEEELKDDDETGDTSQPS